MHWNVFRELNAFVMKSSSFSFDSLFGSHYLFLRKKYDYIYFNLELFHCSYAYLYFPLELHNLYYYFQILSSSVIVIFSRSVRFERYYIIVKFFFSNRVKKRNFDRQSTSGTLTYKVNA